MMDNIVTLFILLVSLYTSGIQISDPVFMEKAITDMQLYGAEAVVERYKQDLPAILAEAGIQIPEELPSNTPLVPGDTLSGTPGDAGDTGTSASGEIIQESPFVDTNKKDIDLSTIDYKAELIRLGYFQQESMDANLNLRNAVLRFQSDCNLTVDGIWGKKSLKALGDRLITENARCEDIIAEPPSAGKWIVINKSKRILTLYEGSTIIKKYPVAIGNPPSLTPDGKYTIVSKVINPTWGGGGYAKPVKGGIPENPLGYRWLGLSYKSGSDLGIHGNNSPYSIGKNVSHGCIRMINTDVEQLFTTVPRSIPVWIGTEAILNEWGIDQKEYTI